MRIVGLSHTGTTRSVNEDAIGWDEAAGVAVVADGLSTEPAGETASQLAVEEIIRVARERSKPGGAWLSGGGNPAELMRTTNQLVFDHGAARPECKGMATACALVCFDERRTVVVHVGDCRVYRLREGLLRRLTRDQNFVQQELDRELLDPELAARSRQRHHLLSALGADIEVEPQVQELDRRPGDIYLLCSDGLSEALFDSEIEQTLTEYQHEPDTAVRSLVHSAVGHAGPEDVSAIVVRT